MKLSACLIVKNEEELLARCLETIKEADEIVVCDTGSEDKTVEIAKKYTSKVYTDYKWADNFAKARNHAISKCTGDWILIIDADDTLEVGGIEKIRKVMEEAKEDQLVFNFLVTGEDEHFYQPRLLRSNKGVYYKGAVHNHMSVTQKDNKADIKITFTYSLSHRKDPDRNLRILKREVTTNPELAREKFYLAREYINRKEYTAAVYWYKKYLKVAHFELEIAESYLQLAQCYWRFNKVEQARDYCLQAINTNADFKEALLLMAELAEPKNKNRWLQFAKIAKSKDVLFTRH